MNEGTSAKILVFAAFVLWVMVLLVPYRSAAQSTDNNEPNDSMNEATAFDPDVQQLFNISSAGDVDWFQFYLDDRTYVQLSACIMESGNISSQISLELYNAGGVLLDRVQPDSASADFHCAVTEMVLTSGNFFIKIAEYGNDAEIPLYELRLEQITADPFESNDAMSEASYLYPYDPVKLNLFPKGDVDWFSFQLEENSNIKLAVWEKTGDIRITLYDKDGAEIANTSENVLLSSGKRTAAAESTKTNSVDFDPTGENASTLLLQKLPEGRYFVKIDEVSTLDSRPNYTLILIVDELDEYEIDDADSQAKPLEFNTPQRHSILPEGDVDWLTFTLTETTALRIETYGNDGDTRLWLYSESDSTTAITENDDGGENAFSKMALILSPGVYYVKVDEYYDEWDEQDVIEEYYIVMNIVTPDELEADGSKENAVSMTSGMEQYHNLYPQTDEDWLTFSLDSETTVQFELEITGGGTQIQLLKSENGTLTEINSGNSSDYENYILLGATLSAGTYYLKVSKYGTDNWIPEYTIYFKTLQPDQHEQNDTPETAKAMIPGEVYRANMAPEGDMDWYRLNITEKTYVIILSYLPEQTGYIEMTLYDSSGMIVESPYLNPPEINMPYPHNMISATLEPGTYYIYIDEAGEFFATSYEIAFWPIGADAYEQDDTPGEAVSLEPGIAQEHNIIPGNDLDWMKFRLEEDTAISFETYVGQGIIDITLYRMENGSLHEVDFASFSAYDNYSAVEPPRLSRILAAGQYYIMAKGGEFDDKDNLGAHYDIILFQLQLDEYELDNSPEEATLLEFGIPQEHGIVPDGDEDWFVFTLDQDENVIIETWGEEGDTQLTLFSDGNGYLDEIAYDDDSGEAGFSMIVTTLSAGTYYVLANVFEYGDSIPSYTIQLTSDTEMTEWQDELEPNDTSDKASDMVCGNLTVGTIYPYTDQDWFTLTLEGGRHFILEAYSFEGGVNGDLKVKMYENQTDLTEIHYGEYFTDGSYTFIQADLNAGNYFVKLVGYGNEDSVIEYGMECYDISSAPTIEADSYEDDDTWDTATIIRSGIPQEHSIDSSGDEDWFVFTLEEETDVLIETWEGEDAIGIKEGDVQIRLYGYDTQLTEIASDLNSTDGFFPYIEITLDPGTYYIQALNDTQNRYIISFMEIVTLFERITEGKLKGVTADIYVDSAAPPTFADIDNDGDYDMLLGSVHGQIQFYRNDGTQGYPSWTLITEAYADIDRGRWSNIVPAWVDIDNDSDFDLFLIERDHIVYYENKGSQTESDYRLITENYASIDGDDYQFSSIKFTDIDTDGDFDLFLAGGIPNQPKSFKIFQYENIGSASYASWKKVADSALGSITLSGEGRIGFGDLDGDGDKDLYIHGGLLNDFMKYENSGTAASPQWSTSAETVMSTKIKPVSVLFIDIDFDGDEDLYLGNNFYQNVGTASSPSFMESKSNHLSRLYAWRFTPADIDADGDNDLFIEKSDQEINYIQMYENTGTPATASWTPVDGRFANFTIRGLSLSPSFADIDGDNDLDLFVGVGNRETGQIYYIQNDGTPTSPSWKTKIPLGLTTDSGPIIIKFADIDNDNDLDIFAGYAQNKIAFAENIGSPTSPNWTIVTGNYIPNCGESAVPALFDIDDDGDLDLFVGNLSGTIRFFMNKDIDVLEGGSDSIIDEPKWEFITPVFSGIESLYGSASPLFIDMDADGDKDLFVGTPGGLHYYLNKTPHLKIHPISKTAAVGTSVDFDVQEAGGNVTFEILKNNSGGTINPTSGNYTAGQTSNVIDYIEATDENGMYGRALVNVISESQIDSAGKAIIIAGSRADDNVWSSTSYMASFAYQTLKYRGFSDDNIYLLSGGDPEIDHTDAEATIENVRYAFETFAKNTTDLTVFLVDHGEADKDAKAWFRLNPDETLAATDLDILLDGVQTAECKVTLIIDCCNSGSFLSALTPPSNKKRIVIASTGTTTPTYFIAGGMISFSQSFFSSVYAGYDVLSAFEAAASAMSSFQTPMFDDNGDGSYNKDNDGAIAENTYIGAEDLGGFERPVIGKICPNQIIESGTQATIWAADITGNYDIANVWAVVIPPTYAPDPDDPVVDLPEFELTYNSKQKQWVGVYEGFTESGTYAVMIYAQDIWETVSAPKLTYVSQAGFDEKVIVVAGNGAFCDSADWESTKYLTDFVYQTLQNRWIDKSDIYYLNKTNSDKSPTLSNLTYAVNTWAKDADKLTLYFVGFGDENGFHLNETEILTPIALDDLLDAYQTVVKRTVIVVFDASKSGGWIDDLQPPDNASRLIIAGAPSDAVALCQADGRISFTQFFMNRILLGENVLDAFIATVDAIRFFQGMNGDPKLDDNGNGIPNEKVSDGELSNMTYIGSAFVIGTDLPQIGSTMEDLVLDDTTTATIWAKNVTDGDGISAVRATIIPPDPESEMYTVTLTYNTETERYEYTTDAFTETGTYIIVIYAEDNENNLSESIEVLIHQPGSSSQEEPEQLDVDVIVLNNDAVTHDFQSENEADWFKFYGVAGEVYTIEAQNLESNCDIVIELYDTDGTTLIDFRDTLFKPQAEETLSWSCPEDGVYYIKIHHYDTSAYGENTAYDLQIYHPVGAFAGFVSGTVTDASTGNPIDGATLQTTLHASAISQNNGGYTMIHPAGNFGITANASGYISQTYSDYTLSEGGSEVIDVTLNPTDSQPVATIKAPANAVSIEQGESVTFTGSVTDGNAPLSYSWDFGGGAANSAEISPGDVIFAFSGIFTVTFTVIDDDGDTDSDSVVITVTESDTIPVAAIISPAGDTEISAGESISFSGEVTDGNAPFVYYWNFNGGADNMAVQNPGDIVFNIAGEYTVSFSVTDQDGDTGSDTVRIIVHSPSEDTEPAAAIIDPDTDITVTEGDTIDFVSGVTGGNAPYSYDWNFGGGATDSQEKDPRSVSFSTPGVFTITLTVTDADGDIASDSIVITVNSQSEDSEPVAAILTPEADVSIYEGNAVTFTGNVVNGDAPFTFLWNFDGAAANAEIKDPGEVIFIDADIYTITFQVTDSDGDTSTDSVTVTVYDKEPEFKPELLFPEDGAVNVSLKPVLQAQTPETSGHWKTRWQLAAATDFADIILDLTHTEYLTSMAVPALILEPASTYYWRVRFYTDDDTVVFVWSAPFSFTTIIENSIDANDNGIPDALETDASADLDGNGVADESQENIKSFDTAAGNAQIGIKANDNVDKIVFAESILLADISDDRNKPESMGMGVVRFKIIVDDPDVPAQVEIIFSQNITEGAVWYGYNSFNGWFDASDMISANPDGRSVILMISDGGSADADGVSNGVIVFTVGPGFAQTGEPIPFPSAPESGEVGGCFIEVLF